MKKRNKLIDKTLGKSTREQYLIENPHGYTKILKVHKNKKKYNRKNKPEV